MADNNNIPWLTVWGAIEKKQEDLSERIKKLRERLNAIGGRTVSNLTPKQLENVKFVLAGENYKAPIQREKYIKRPRYKKPKKKILKPEPTDIELRYCALMTELAELTKETGRTPFIIDRENYYNNQGSIGNSNHTISNEALRLLRHEDFILDNIPNLKLRQQLQIEAAGANYECGGLKKDRCLTYQEIESIPGIS